MMNSMQFVSCRRGRVVGGETAKKSYPYQVAIEYVQPLKFYKIVISNYTQFCGGSIINNDTILTAGVYDFHCLNLHFIKIHIFI